MRKPRFPDVVQLTHSLPEHGLGEGERGTIVMEYEIPHEAYEVEFSDDDGETIAMVALTPDQFEVVIPYDRVVSPMAGS